MLILYRFLDIVLCLPIKMYSIVFSFFLILAFVELTTESSGSVEDECLDVVDDVVSDVVDVVMFLVDTVVEDEFGLIRLFNPPARSVVDLDDLFDDTEASCVLPARLPAVDGFRGSGGLDLMTIPLPPVILPPFVFAHSLFLDLVAFSCAKSVFLCDNRATPCTSLFYFLLTYVFLGRSFFPRGLRRWRRILGHSHVHRGSRKIASGHFFLGRAVPLIGVARHQRQR